MNAIAAWFARPMTYAEYTRMNQLRADEGFSPLFTTYGAYLDACRSTPAVNPAH